MRSAGNPPTRRTGYQGGGPLESCVAGAAQEFSLKLCGEGETGVSAFNSDWH
jgi:hypothetical protein